VEFLYKIAKDYGQKVFIGLRGGEDALRQMPADEIRKKQWQISTVKASREWSYGNIFQNILDEKRVYN